ncbi:PDDEXK-like family protein [Komagataeibacter melomenusus]
MNNINIDINNDIMLCRRLPALLNTMRPLLGRHDLVSFCVPDIMPERIGELTNIIMPLHNQAWERGDAINIWDVAGLKYNEGRNSAVLGWLLDPQGTHGWGARLLRDVLRLAGDRYPHWPRLDKDLNTVSVVTECWPAGSTTERVDIAVDGDDFVLFIEIKIQAREGRQQLARYVKVAEAKRQITGRQHGLVLYLSTIAPVDPPEEVALMTWRDVADILAQFPKGGFNGAITQQFAQHIRKFH